MSETRKKAQVSFVQPMLQATLLHQIESVAACLDVQNYLSAWSALDTLYLQSPPNVKSDVKEAFDGALKVLREVSHLKGVNVYDTIHLRSRKRLRTIMLAARPLYGLVVESLYRNGYLEVYRKNTSTNLNPELMSELGM